MRASEVLNADFTDPDTSSELWLALRIADYAWPRTASRQALTAFRSLSTGITSRANSRASAREKVSTSRRRAPVSSIAC
jgi:hypothetical protein